MDILNIFNTLIIDPVYNALIFFYNLTGDMGLAIISITIIVRVLLLPLANKALRSQRRMQALQPELKKLQDKHKDDREAMAREVMSFYKREGVSPASSCLPTIVQIPLLIALFLVFRDAVSGHTHLLYSFVSDPGVIDTKFLGGIDLAKHDTTFILPLATALLQFQQSRMLMASTPGGAPGAAMSKQFVYILPIVTFVFATSLPAALPLYWASSTLFTVIQQYVIIRSMPLAQAKAEGAQDWNAANPQDPVTKPRKSGKAKKSGGAQVTVRKRGKS